MKTLLPFLLGAFAVSASSQVASSLRPDQLAFQETFRELVETNTTLSSGSCSLAAERMAARLKAAGFTDNQLTLFATPEHPKEGGLVAIYPGTSKTAKPLLLIAHIDVVEARREDWDRDPFTLFEENGYFYARGTADTKALAAVWVDSLIRFKREGYAPSRSIKVALTCGEETNGAFNGIEWLAANRRELIDAESRGTTRSAGRRTHRGAGGLRRPRLPVRSDQDVRELSLELVTRVSASAESALIHAQLRTVALRAAPNMLDSITAHPRQ